LYKKQPDSENIFCVQAVIAEWATPPLSKGREAAAKAARHQSNPQQQQEQDRARKRRGPGEGDGGGSKKTKAKWLLLPLPMLLY